MWRGGYRGECGEGDIEVSVERVYRGECGEGDIEVSVERGI